ncbi:hypothetical protein Cva_01744 [Caedimonas varicaedens]|uniref:Carbohydrate binding domain protein n=1 Tax=Caedimonas varicaedens TaxID=1629334 RepID=A0A0K8MGS0_9PROT|nr:hypothetical protein Cva_01744 [Caedimonas varicaedens]
MGWVAADGKLYTGFNVDNISHKELGKYYITFKTPASSDSYIVLVTPYYKEAQGVHAEPQVTRATYFSVFCSGNKDPEEFINNSFFFGVWDLGVASNVSVS